MHSRMHFKIHSLKCLENYVSRKKASKYLTDIHLRSTYKTTPLRFLILWPLNFFPKSQGREGLISMTYVDLALIHKSVYFLFFFFLLFRAAATAYGGSQAGVKAELYPPVYTRATATQDMNRICNLHHSLGKVGSLTH